MADWLRTEIAKLTTEAVALGETVTYRRGPHSVSIDALRGNLVIRIGNTVIRTDNDFMIEASKLILGGQLTTPMLGDVIDATEGTRTIRYEVNSPGGEEPHYRETAGMLRAHTQRLGEPL